MENNNIRLKKIEDMMLHAVTHLVRTEVRDPLLKTVRITRLRVTADLTKARVYFDIPLGGVTQKKAFSGLNRCKSFLKREVTRFIELKRLPDFEFFYDETGDLEQNVEDLFKQLDTQKIKDTSKKT